MFIQQSLTTILGCIHPGVQKGSGEISPFPGSGEDKVSHYAEGQGESAASGASVAFEASSDQSHHNNAASSFN